MLPESEAYADEDILSTYPSKLRFAPSAVADLLPDHKGRDKGRKFIHLYNRNHPFEWLILRLIAVL